MKKVIVDCEDQEDLEYLIKFLDKMGYGHEVVDDEV